MTAPFPFGSLDDVLAACQAAAELAEAANSVSVARVSREYPRFGKAVEAYADVLMEASFYLSSKVGLYANLSSLNSGCRRYPRIYCLTRAREPPSRHGE